MTMRPDIKNIFLSVCILFAHPSLAQPYIDLGKISYGYAPVSGLNKKDNPLSSGYYNINLTVPMELRKNGDAIHINPFFEHNKGKVSGNKFHVISEGISAGFLNKIKKSPWSIYTAFILRHNKEIDKNLNDAWQYGAAILTSYEKNKWLTLKFGLYYNKEFFGNFFMPLAGIDWKINERNNVFGVLPGNLTFEHKVNHSFYYRICIQGTYQLLPFINNRRLFSWRLQREKLFTNQRQPDRSFC